MSHRLVVLLFTLVLHVGSVVAHEKFVGHFAEPRDGGNLDTDRSTFDGLTVTIVPRAHANEAVSGGTRWRTVWFAVRGVQGKTPAFRLPLTSPGSGKVILSGDAVSFQNIKMVWSYEPKPAVWNTFDTYTRTGSGASTWRVEGRNHTPFTRDVVYVSINERAAVEDFYEWLEADVFTHPRVFPTPSEALPGSFVIGYQSGAPASAAFSRDIPDMPLFGFVIKDPAANPTKLVMLVSGQHPYEGQNKVALKAAVDWIMNSDTPEAKAYRAQYLTVVYPFVNPTGELAGLWRGTAYAPNKDTNRNWHTGETVPSKNRGIDTVIVHKNAMKTDISALGLGEPYAVFDYHQNYGDRPATPDYLLHATLSVSSSAPASRRAALTDFAPYFARLQLATSIGDAPSDLTSQETLRGYMVARGVKLPLTFERSVYNKLETEVAFGEATVRALVDPATIIVPEPQTPPPAPEPEPEPEAETPVEAPAPEETVPEEIAPEDEAPELELETPEPEPETTPEAAPAIVFIDDSFEGGEFLNRRTPDRIAVNDAAWSVHSGVIKMAANASVTTNTSGYATIECGTADGEVSTTVAIGSNNTGLLLRSTNSSNYLRFMISSTRWMLQKTSNGSTSSIASGAVAYSTSVDHTLVARLSGSSITLVVDGVTLGTFEVEFNRDATRHGLIANGSGVRYWRDFAVREL
jgi:Periplasmic protein TonB, links inner and outer membranes